MAVDLADLILDLQAEVNAPGSETFPDAEDDHWIQLLSDGFWNAVLDGIITGYTSDGELVTPVTGTTDLSRELQQVIVFYAGFQAIRNKILNTPTMFSAKAGPVEYETQQSANVFRDLLADLAQRRAILLTRLSTLGQVEVQYVDMVAARTDSIIYGYTSFLSSTQ